MTQEERQLLLKDICGRLPYGVKCKIAAYTCYTFQPEFLSNIECHEIYLRPMSSMTEDERNFLKEQEWAIAVSASGTVETTTEGFDWLNEHHFDYRGLIPMGLALEAKEGIYD